jgi:hypothetical protein
LSHLLVFGRTGALPSTVRCKASSRRRVSWCDLKMIVAKFVWLVLATNAKIDLNSIKLQSKLF